MAPIITFIHLVFVAFLTLFPPVNPVGTSFIIDPMLTHLSRKERLVAAKKIALYCFVICVTSVIIGSWILKLFGLSLPIVQIAGGLTICNMGWNLLNSDNSASENSSSEKTIQPQDKFSKIENSLFYPMSFPMMCGAGTISVLLTLSASTSFQNIEQYLWNTSALIVGIFCMTVVIYICVANTHILLEKIGERGKQIVNRLSAFIVFCIGLQIFWEGLQVLLSLK
ncbi:MarC family protein [Flavobacterium sp. 5]|uniref:MarC family protein n=1 Tax=Flavobacterium sp. 5 TaxID=2035199 RepID=UPI0012FD579D|nr:MarC family protein [Flavobacterium sp. 5]